MKCAWAWLLVLIDISESFKWNFDWVSFWLFGSFTYNYMYFLLITCHYGHHNHMEIFYHFSSTVVVFSWSFELHLPVNKLTSRDVYVQFETYSNLISATIIDPYVPPEGDGKSSLLSSEVRNNVSKQSCGSWIVAVEINFIQIEI